MNPYFQASDIPVAADIEFNNSTNGFSADDVQSAIEEAKNTRIYYNATGTSTLTRTAATFTTVNGMTHTPEAGTYLAFWSGQVDVTNTSGQGEVAIFVNGVQQTALTHQTQIVVTVVLGVLGAASITEGGSNITGIVTANGTDVVDVRFRSVDGRTITLSNRSFVLIRVA